MGSMSWSQKELDEYLARQQKQGKVALTVRTVNNMPPPPRKNANKYNSQKTVVDGITFDSQKEAKKWQTLDAMQSMGRISKLRHHVTFDLVVNKVFIGQYVADFVYVGNTGQLVIDDTKGYKKGSAWQLFCWKAKLMKAIYGADVLVNGKEINE